MFPPDIKGLHKDIKSLKADMKDHGKWHRFTTAFKTLAEPRRHKNGKPKKDSKCLSLYYLTERSLTENFEKLFGYKCDVLAKIMYIKLSKRKDCAKINLVRFH